MSKEVQLFDLNVTKIREALKDKLLNQKNDLRSKYETKKVLNQNEQKKMAFSQRQTAQKQTSHSNEEM
ncbi:hypothetical protein [Staphylococcus pseudintermedius]|uniref:hypothetical protein n=1 Tax=Staphylococcus pseudintermedius TaxID=283734 RepID=UPI001E28C8C7|nr:hypothetical protein [Staphylococcus pseudintermedius]